MFYPQLAKIVFDLQASISCLGIFVCTWGATQHSHCLWRVLTAKMLKPHEAHCPRHAYVAMLCFAGIVLAFARLNTIGVINLGSTAAGLVYISGMFIMVVSVGLAIWAKARTHENMNSLSWRTPIPNTPALSRILAALLIVTLAFIGVGLLSLGK